MYIEINLLPREFRPKKQLLLLNVPFLATVIFIIGALALGGYYWYVNQNIESLRGQVQFMRGEKAKLQTLVDMQVEVNRIKTTIGERVDIIEQLTGQSDVRFAMLQHINRILPENLWLLSITEQNINLDTGFEIEGMTFTKDSISELIAGLERFEHFTSVNLESITPSPMEVQDAFNYRVSVVLEPLSEPEPAEE